jgi:hypothetical protein
MQNYKKFMAQVEDRISKMNRKPTKSSTGIMSRKDKENVEMDSDYVDIIATYVATIRKTAQKVKAKNGA